MHFNTFQYISIHFDTFQYISIHFHTFQYILIHQYIFIHFNTFASVRNVNVARFARIVVKWDFWVIFKYCGIINLTFKICIFSIAWRILENYRKFYSRMDETIHQRHGLQHVPRKIPMVFRRKTKRFRYTKKSHSNQLSFIKTFNSELHWPTCQGQSGQGCTHLGKRWTGSRSQNQLQRTFSND